MKSLVCWLPQGGSIDMSQRQTIIPYRNLDSSATTVRAKMGAQ